MKLTMVCERDIGQFVVTIAGLYAWRSKLLASKDKDLAWNLGILKKGDVIDGQYEGTGPITWKTF